MNKFDLTIVPPFQESAVEPNINWIIMKRKVDPHTRTEVVIKLKGKERHIFITKPGQDEEDITHLFNSYDKRVFAQIFWKLLKNEL